MKAARKQARDKRQQILESETIPAVAKAVARILRASARRQGMERLDGSGARPLPSQTLLASITALQRGCTPGRTRAIGACVGFAGAGAGDASQYGHDPLARVLEDKLQSVDASR